MLRTLTSSNSLHGVRALHTSRVAASRMSIILTEDVQGHGFKGEEIKARRGFARNYLFQKKMAVYATPENMALYGLKKRKTGDAAQSRSTSGTRRRYVDHLQLRLNSTRLDFVRQRKLGQQDLEADFTVLDMHKVIARKHNLAIFGPSAITFDAPAATPTTINKIGAYTATLRLSEEEGDSVQIKFRVVPPPRKIVKVV